jgi:phage tail-like protein
MPSLGLNAGYSLVTNLLGVRLDPYKAFNFVVEIEGILAGGFSECRGLSVETEVHEYREGGVNDYAHQFAGPTKYPALVLKHGITALDGLWEWHQDVVRGNITRRNGSIYLLNERRLPVTWWDFKEALPVRWNGPELQSTSAAVAFETIELIHHGLSRPKVAGRLLAAAAAAAEKSGL